MVARCLRVRRGLGHAKVNEMYVEAALFASGSLMYAASENIANRESIYLKQSTLQRKLDRRSIQEHLFLFYFNDC